MVCTSLAEASVAAWHQSETLALVDKADFTALSAVDPGAVDGVTYRFIVVWRRRQL